MTLTALPRPTAPQTVDLVYQHIDASSDGYMNVHIVKLHAPAHLSR